MTRKELENPARVKPSSIGRNLALLITLYALLILINKLHRPNCTRFMRTTAVSNHHFLKPWTVLLKNLMAICFWTDCSHYESVSCTQYRKVASCFFSLLAICPFWTALDACSSKPCQNGATCQAAGRNYSCTCPPNHHGQQCQIGKTAWASNSPSTLYYCA